MRNKYNAQQLALEQAKESYAEISSQRDSLMSERLELFQQLLKFALYDVSLDRLAIGLAASREAHVVRILLVPAFGPTRGHGLFAAGTGDETPQWEVFTQIFASGSIGSSVEAILHLAIRVKAHQSLMLGRNEV